jgi:hypothetical protein
LGEPCRSFFETINNHTELRNFDDTYATFVNVQEFVDATRMGRRPALTMIRE